MTECDTFREVTMAMSSMIKQHSARKAEKALKEVLNKADSNLNGKVALSEFVLILEANGVEVSMTKSVKSDTGNGLLR